MSCLPLAEITRIKNRVTELEQQNEKLREAAQAVINRWDSPRWCWHEPTGKFINALREALAATQPQQTGKE